MKKWMPLLVLASAQFLVILDTSVMNVAVSQLVLDFKTDITQIQTAITFYALIIAAFTITGGKIGDVWGRRKTFVIGMGIYAIGSAITAIARTVPALMIGWSGLEGIGSALILPAMYALTSSNYKGKERATAFGLIGGVSGIGVAVGPVIGGWVTTNLTWRYVFAFEVVAAIAIVLLSRVIKDSKRPAERPKIDWVGSALSAIGLGLIVFGAIKSSQWGMLFPRNSPIEPLGFALTPFVIGAGFLVLYFFIKWQQRRERLNKDPLIHLRLFKISQLTSGLMMIIVQNVILAGIFFALPLFLQLTIGFDAFNTGLRMLPLSITLLVTSLAGAMLMKSTSPKKIIQIALTALFVGVIMMLSTIEPSLKGFTFGLSMAIIGIGIGLMAAVLGNQTQSSVEEKDSSEAGALSNTSVKLGNALGTAVIGAIVISGLATSFIDQIARNERLSPQISEAVQVELADGVTFVSSSEVRLALEKTSDETQEIKDAIVDSYAVAQLEALRLALFITLVIIIGAFFLTPKLPAEPLAS